MAASEINEQSDEAKPDLTKKPEPNIDWHRVKAEVEDQQRMRERLKLDEDSKNDTNGSVDMQQYLKMMSKPAYHHTSYHISPKGNLNLLTAGEHLKSIMPVEKGMVWAQVPCAADSGACAHVAPPGIFGESSKDKVHKAKYYGADGSPIDEFGSLSVNAVLGGRTAMATAFDIVNITRPLLSVNQMVANGDNWVFGKDSSYIQVSGSKQRIYLRPEGKLYMLDLWVKIPVELSRSSPFVRQVSPA